MVYDRYSDVANPHLPTTEHYLSHIAVASILWEIDCAVDPYQPYIGRIGALWLRVALW